MIFDDTRDFLQITERTLLELEHGKHKLMNRIADIILFNNMSFICFSGNCNIVIKILVVAIILFVAVSLFAGFAAPLMIINGFLALVIATIFCTLTMPSKIVGSDIKSKDIEAIYNIIKKKKLSCSQLQAVKNDLLILETAFDTKVKTSKWIIAVLWAVFLYMLAQYYFPSVIERKTMTLKVALAFLLTMVFIAILYLVTSSFCKTGKRVFMTLSFALNEAISKAKQ